jgi:hypothetical protein
MTSGYCRLTVTADTLLVAAPVNKFDLLNSVCCVQSGSDISCLPRYRHLLKEGNNMDGNYNRDRERERVEGKKRIKKIIKY